MTCPRFPFRLFLLPSIFVVLPPPVVFAYVLNQGDSPIPLSATIHKGESVVCLDGKKFDVRRHEGLLALSNELKVMLAPKQSAIRDRVQLAGTVSEYSDRSKERKPRPALIAMKSTVDRILDGHEEEAKGLVTILEIDRARMNDKRTQYVWRDSLDLASMVFRVRDLSLNAVGRGNRSNPAMNVENPSAADLSRVDPIPSTFWSRPESIAARNLYNGFGRTSIPQFDKAVTYAEPHDG